MKALLVIKGAIEQYEADREDLTLEQVQEIRDDISTALYTLSDHYADCKFRSESAEYFRKKAVAEQANALYGELSDNKKKHTQKSAELQAVINSSDSYTKEHAANREYEYIRQIFNTANGVMNGIASRLHILMRNE